MPPPLLLSDFIFSPHTSHSSFSARHLSSGKMLLFTNTVLLRQLGHFIVSKAGSSAGFFESEAMLQN